MAIDFRMPYTSRDIDTIMDELETLVLNTDPDKWSDFFESNLGQLVIRMLAVVGDMVSMGQDIVGGETFLDTAQIYDSALRFCRSVGYKPRSATPAEVTVYSVTMPSQVTLNGATVPAGSKITGQTGLQYELLEDVEIPAGATSASLPLVEGQGFEEEFDPTAQPKQEITTANGVVAEGSWNVYVGAVSPANLWEQVDSLALETEATKTYEISFDGDGKLKVLFGDGASGKIPDDTITVQYRTTNGSEGDAPIYAISGSVKADITGGLGTVSIQFENSQSKASGGADREGSSELQTNVPGYIRSQDQVLTLSDYEANVPRVSGVALVFADLVVTSYAKNVARVHAWTTEDVTFTAETYDDSVQSEAEYTRFAQLPYDRMDDIQVFLAERTPLNVHSAVVRPGVAYADVYLSQVMYDAGYTDEEIHAAILAAVIGAFENAGGFEVKLSDLYNAINDVDGVRTFYLDRIVFERLRNIPATGTIELAAQPADGDTITIGDGIETETFEFDSDYHVGTGNIDVTIGATAAETLENLRVLIESHLTITAITATGTSNPTLNLTNDTPGTGGNQTITKSGANISVAGMVGGADTPEWEIVDYRRDQDIAPEDDQWPPGTYDESSPATGQVVFDGGANPTDGETITVGDGVDTETFEFESGGGVTPGNVSVTIGGTAAATLANLETAIETYLDIIGTIDAGATDPTLDLENNESGAVGNVTITTTGANITVSGMSGGGTGVGYWRDGGIEPYEAMMDLQIPAALRHSNRYYNSMYLYNNEIYYNAGDFEESVVQAITLRRLIMGLAPERED